MELLFNCFKATPDVFKVISRSETTLHRFGRRVSSKVMLVLAFLITSTLTVSSTLMAQEGVTPPTAQEIITPLISKDLAGLPDEEVLMYTVEFRRAFQVLSTAMMRK